MNKNLKIRKFNFILFKVRPLKNINQIGLLNDCLYCIINIVINY